MAQQKRGPINGLDPLIYTGGLPNLVVMDRRPTPADYAQYFLGHWWIIPELDESPDEEVWVLVSKRNGVAKWKKLHGGGGPTPPVQSRMINKIYLTTTGAGTYTPTEGMLQCYVECVGGGAGVGTSSYSPGGGGGGYSAKLYNAPDIVNSSPYFVGAGGLGASTINGENTTFGVGSTLITAGGGTAQIGGVASGGDINISGGIGGQSDAGSIRNINGSGGASLFGFGGQLLDPFFPGDINGQLYGGGGGGHSSPGLTSNGAHGIIIITEYLG